MIIKIKTVVPWIAQNRKIKVGDKLEVKGEGVSREKSGRKYKMVDDKEGKCIIFYEDEYEIIKP